MARRKKKAKKLLRWVTAKLWPAEDCPGCDGLKPDLRINVHGKWVRPKVDAVYCGMDCYRRNTKRGGLEWLKQRHPDLVELLSLPES